MYWWMPLLWLVVTAGVIVLALWLHARRRARNLADAVPVAHSDRLTELPAYRTALARYRAALFGAVLVVSLVLVAAVLMSSRLVSISTYQPEMRNRDIVLCLDVSGSMVDYDAAIVRTFRDLVDNFDGERIGLVLFNASAVTYFPLTTDYRFVQEQLAYLENDLSSPLSDYEFINGTLLGEGSSLIGDGLGSCVLRFDDVDKERSRSIVLATDNYVAGRPILTLPEAGALATERSVRVYGINPGDVSSKEYIAEFANEMKQVVLATDGGYFALADPSAIPSIVDGIEQQQTTRLTGEPMLVRTDEPSWPFVLSVLGTALIMYFGWRLKR
ncbi:VWA domain-containing protein [Mycetocola miduiensis]|nr:VWA domain-containing protein [Mycetocola miduiensis]